ncbi:MAG TPA: S1/P1 nuclease, partial [Pyrinomonadaceae bacterium]|nr:S1/P1 nuclease [Pyrinomonadaceae bacterium]
MDEVTLKHGRTNITLRKSDDLIAIRPSSQAANVAEVLAHALADTSAVGTKLDQFQIVKVNATPATMETTLNTLRESYLVDAGSHVYHTEKSAAPIVPTGKLTVRFTPSSTKEERERVLLEHNLEVVESDVDEVNGSKVTTYTLRTTPDSPNPLKVVKELQDSSDVVALAEADLATPGALALFQMPGDTLLKEQWHLRNTGIQFGNSTGLTPGADARVIAAWQRAQSLGSPACIVAVIDDGFDMTHPDLTGNSKVVAPFDFTTNTNDPAPRRFSTDPRQGDYHGTACAGVAIGNANRVGITGAAPDCRFMPVRWTGTISNDTIRRQFAYVAAQGAWVVSCSWGAAAPFFPLSTVMEEAIARCARAGRNGLGCVILFAAGNANRDVNDPNGGTLNGFAVHPDVIAVAACNSMDQKSNYSNFGREISICAPSSGAGGVSILTSDVRGSFQINGQAFAAGYDAGDYTRTFGGTSSATPLVAGICALILSVNPRLTSREVKQILESTTRRIGPANSYDARGHSIFFGFGCVDADAAVRKAMESVAPAELSTRPVRSNNNGKPSMSESTLYGSEFWGISRHELIASVATNFLTPRAKSEIAKILQPIGQTMTQIAGWADQIKGKKPSPGMDTDTRDFLKQYPNDASKPWHYVDLPLGISSYDEAQRLRFTRDDDVVQIIERCVLVLQG